MKNKGLYHSSNEHDSCGVGFVANINGEYTHRIIEDGLDMLQNLMHRGAVGSDNKTGDGAGLLLRVPHEFFKKAVDFNLPSRGHYGVAFLFLPRKKEKKEKLLSLLNKIIKKEGGDILGLREVPVNTESLGETAFKSMPDFMQLFVRFPGLDGDALERKLYVVRKTIQNKVFLSDIKSKDFYVSSFSSLTIIYKGLLAGKQLKEFYLDLGNKHFKSPFSLIHQRYSTNTFPSWPLAQPFRHIAHNGEINTLKGNINYMKAREGTLSSKIFKSDIKKLFPIIEEGSSDSAAFDCAFELLLKSGRSAEHVMMMMLPEAFGTAYHMSFARRAFYEYHACFQEPWDGPAAVAFTDGTKIGAALDRNGLRPLRYTVTNKGKIVMASETGVLDIPASDISQKGRLGPGKMLVVDIANKIIKKDAEIKSEVSRRKPYARWLEENKIELKGLHQPPEDFEIEHEALKKNQKLFGYTLEDLNMVIKPMAETGQEHIGSMGDDEQPAAISYKPQLLFRYFKQLFAQVTNPPIDPYRENLVMSLMSFTGAEYNLLEEGPLHCRQLKLSHPVLSNKDIQKILYRKGGGLGAQRVDMLFEAGKGSAAMEKALEALCAESEKKIDEGNSIIILSDRNSDSNYAPLPSLLAVSVVNNYLTAKGKRHLAGLIIESGEAREVTDFALLIGFGASAVNPYLALDTVSSLCEKSIISGPAKAEDALDNYITAVKKGLLKIMSKMGISTIRSYKFAQIFEAVGLNSEFTNKYFPGLNSPVEGVGIKKIYNDYSQMHKKAYNCALNESISSGGRYLYRKNSVKHLLTPDVVIRFRQAVMKGDYGKYKEFSQLIDSSEITLRNFLNFKSSKAIPLEKVEKESSILKRFYSCAMSFGSISKEAHETIAVAMNRLGCSSNSGEGGEDSKRYNTEKNSAVKQVASGRFGVNINYLANAKELQIKMAQGAKPGEGGQLPGHKVDEEIAGVRNSTPGVMLISPPPHHDIYSIEDLAQLIYDLKSANTSARVSVKLVSESGVGTIAAGVAKAGADMVLISGGDGGTGASPISSIKNAGIPWEIGLSETHQTLVLNNLRNRLRLQVDGQIRTGRDVVMGALMGAEEFGFGTAALMTMGCVMVRHCHSNTCPVGVATQDPVLRKRFMGKPEYLMNYLTFVARHTREIMARLGFKNIDDMVGRAEKLIPSQKADGKGFDFSKLLACPGDRKKSVMIFSSETRKDNKEKSLNKTILNDTMSRIKNLNGKKSFSLNYSIKNRDRSVGAQLSGEIAKKYGLKGLGDKNIKVSFRGSAGQSFAAFLSKGLFFSLEGDANDYLAKGLSGGVVTLFPDRNSSFEPSENTISGNVNLFGATSGELYVNGQAGERFGARNSGARAVVEGVGDHGCEYMTGGRVVVLGKTGVNFGAGMSGGIAYVYDRDRLFDTRCNREMVELESLKDKDDIEGLLLMLKKHYNYTRSGKAKSIIEDFNRSLSFFVKVMPLDYKKALAAIREKENRESEREIITEEIY